MGKALDALIAGFGKTRSAAPGHHCAAIGCQGLILPYALFCDECWQKCPSDLKRLIEKHHRPRKKASKVLTKWIQQAVDELLYLKTQGEYRPRAQAFMWDDAPPPRTETDGALFEAGDAKDKV